NSSSAGPSRTSRHKRLRETRRIMSDTAGSRNHGAVDQLLLEAGMDDDGQLRHALVNLRALAAQAPEPSADIAALMAGASAAGPTGHDTGQVPAPLPTAARPSAPTSPDSVPVAPAPSSAPAGVAPSSVPVRPGNTPSHGAAVRKPAEVPTEPSLPANVPEDV